MVFIPLKSAFVAALLTLVAGAPLQKRSGGVVSIPMKKNVNYSRSHNGTLHRRDDAGSPTELDFTGVRYFLDYDIGGQTQSSILDTGSSDTWTFSNKAWDHGFDPSESKDYTWDSDDFEAAYGDGSNRVSGTWAKDTVSVGGATVEQYDFAYLNQTMQNFPDNRGIFGIGPESAQSKDETYPSYPHRLKQAGAIDSNSFSIFDSSEDHTDATLILGGIDEAKYDGPLYTLKFDTRNYLLKQYYSIDFSFQGTKYAGGVLDTGTPFVLLPKDVIDPIAEKYGAEWNDQQGAYIRDSPSDNKDPLTFDLGGIPVVVPGEDLFVEYEGLYLFALSPHLSTPQLELNIIGDPILRQLYLYFNLEDNEVAFSNVTITDESKVTAISDTGSLPNSTPAPDQEQIQDGCVIC